MPKKYTRRRRQKRPYRKKRYKKCSYNGSATIISATSTLPFPKIYKVKMRYADNIVLDTSTGLVANHTFCINGVYDVDITGTGHQPTGFDQIMPFYDHYVVIGCKATFSFATRDDINTALVGITMRDSVAAVTDYREVVEQGNTKHSILGTENGQGIKTIRYAINPNRFLGRSKPMSDPQLKGSILSNPTELAYAHVWAYAPNGGNLNPLDVTVLLEYVVMFIEPKTVGLS